MSRLCVVLHSSLNFLSHTLCLHQIGFFGPLELVRFFIVQETFLLRCLFLSLVIFPFPEFVIQFIIIQLALLVILFIALSCGYEHNECIIKDAFLTIWPRPLLVKTNRAFGPFALVYRFIGSMDTQIASSGVLFWNGFLYLPKDSTSKGTYLSSSPGNFINQKRWTGNLFQGVIVSTFQTLTQLFF